MVIYINYSNYVINDGLVIINLVLSNEYIIHIVLSSNNIIYIVLSNVNLSILDNSN